MDRVLDFMQRQGLAMMRPKQKANKQLPG